MVETWTFYKIHGGLIYQWVLLLLFACDMAVNTIIYGFVFSGFRSVPEELREAARVDSASEWQLYRSIIFPQLSPIALSAIIVIGHISLKSFDLIMSVANQSVYSTKVPAIDMYVFQDNI